MITINTIEKEILPYRKQLQNHSLYKHLDSIDDIKVFMEHHVFAVWDFMSLLKKLQLKLTCTTTPWFPPQSPVLARFVNEIVHGEESDINELGEPKSHFEMYLDAMEQIGADTTKISAFLNKLGSNQDLTSAFKIIDISDSVKQFVEYTFGIIDTEEPHKIASAFTFGREDLIPDMFMEILNNSESHNIESSKLQYYLQRHIELDGDEHGPLSLQLVEQLCENDEIKWQEVLSTAKDSLKQRIALWDGICDEIAANKTVLQ